MHSLIAKKQPQRISFYPVSVRPPTAPVWRNICKTPLLCACIYTADWQEDTCLDCSESAAERHTLKEMKTQHQMNNKYRILTGKKHIKQILNNKEMMNLHRKASWSSWRVCPGSLQSPPLITTLPNSPKREVKGQRSSWVCICFIKTSDYFSKDCASAHK